jgi:ABC-type polysaccharide/polyol phosphate export permease
MLLLHDMRASLKERAFWAYATWLEMITRYRRTRLGVLWMIMPPVAYVLGLGYLYAHMMSKSAAEFIPHLGIGYVLWRFAIQTIIESGDVFTLHQAFIMDGRTRFTDYVLRTFARSFLYLIFGLLVVVGVLLFDPLVKNVSISTLFITMPIFVANVLWMATVVALLGARIRDTKEVITTGLIFGFLLTPILWDASVVPVDTVRGILMRFNPFFHLIEFVRAPALGAMPEISTFWAVAGMTVGGWAFAAFLYNRYARYVPLWI